LLEQGRVQLLPRLALGAFRASQRVLSLLPQTCLLRAAFRGEAGAVVGKESDPKRAGQQHRDDRAAHAEAGIPPLERADAPDALPAL